MAFTKAQLEALKNSLLASNQPILASQHRQQIQSIIDEMYDAQSRANILVGVQSDSVQGGSDTFLVFRSGQAYQLPVSLLNANDLSSLGDVFINNLEDGDSLVYDAVANRWENRNIAIGFALSNLSDVELTSLAGGDILRYDSADNRWENVSLASLLAPYALTTDLNNYQLLDEKGQPNGYASLDTGGKVPLSQINDAILGQVSYQGTWNASTNTPTLANPPSSATKGDYYVVSVGGSFAGLTFEVGDWIISNGTAWEKVNNTDAVRTVFGRLGDVVANASDYASFYVTLDTTQTITGQKTFNFETLRVAGNSPAKPLIITNTNSTAYGSANFNIIGFNSANNLYFNKSVLSGCVIAFENTSVKTYTLPDASGTVALTSDLNAYVTLGTNQTITGVKTFSENSLRVSSVLDFLGNTVVQPSILRNAFPNDYSINNFNTIGFTEFNNLYFSKGTNNNTSILSFNNTAVRTYTLPDASGTIALTNSGTVNFIPKYTPNGFSLGNSQIFDNGTNIGLGISSSLGAKLHVNGSIRSDAENAYILNTNTNPLNEKFWSIQNTSASQFRIRAVNDAQTDGINAIVISRVGVTSTSVNLPSLGTGTVYSNAGTLTNTNPSDLNLKEKINKIEYGLNEILQLNPVTFYWKNDTIEQGKQYGFIAQEVQDVMPDLVKKGDYLGLDKEAIFTILVKGIQELKNENDSLKDILKRNNIN
jgi:hypothetical protein